MEEAVKVLYGHRDHRTVDVTVIFRKQYEKGRRFNSIFGDPCPGVAKHLYFLREDGSCLGVMEENTIEFKPPVDEWKEQVEYVIKRDFKLAVAAIFMNESWILKEWLDHYLEEGVEQFFLINNNSTDDYMSILEPYIKKGWVTLFQEERCHAQVDSYNKYILPAARDTTDWLIICDLDEFIYARKGFARIIDYLDTVTRHISVITIPWKIFGSSHLIEHPRNGVVANFTLRKLYMGQGVSPIGCPNNDVNYCKTICRPKNVRDLQIHSQYNITGYTMTSDGVVVKRNMFQPINETILENSVLHMNHYMIQSWEFFSKIKQSRPDVYAKENVTRDDEYFNRYDINQLSDRELKLKRSNNKDKKI